MRQNLTLCILIYRFQALSLTCYHFLGSRRCQNEIPQVDCLSRFRVNKSVLRDGLINLRYDASCMVLLWNSGSITWSPCKSHKQLIPSFSLIQGLFANLQLSKNTWVVQKDCHLKIIIMEEVMTHDLLHPFSHNLVRDQLFRETSIACYTVQQYMIDE